MKDDWLNIFQKKKKKKANAKTTLKVKKFNSTLNYIMVSIIKRNKE